jgi:hypothetical protein
MFSLWKKTEIDDFSVLPTTENNHRNGVHYYFHLEVEKVWPNRNSRWKPSNTQATPRPRVSILLTYCESEFDFVNLLINKEKECAGGEIFHPRYSYNWPEMAKEHLEKAEYGWKKAGIFQWSFCSSADALNQTIGDSDAETRHFANDVDFLLDQGGWVGKWVEDE